MKTFSCFSAAVLLVLCYLHGTKGKQPLEIIVERKVKSYGQNLQLFCKIDNCCPKHAEWRIDGVVLFLDIKLLNPSYDLVDPRYKARYDSSGIKFVIGNFSSSDLNKTHQCLYDSDQANRILLYDNVFSSASEETTKSDQSTTDSTPRENDPKTDADGETWKIAAAVIGGFVAVLIFVAIFLVRRQNKKRGTDRQSSNRSKSQKDEREMIPLTKTNDRLDSDKPPDTQSTTQQDHKKYMTIHIIPPAQNTTERIAEEAPLKEKDANPCRVTTSLFINNPIVYTIDIPKK